MQLLRPGGWLAYITSNKYMRAAYGEKLRRFLPRTLQMQEVIDFGDLPVFTAAAYPAVVVGKKVTEPGHGNPVAAVDLNLPIRKRILEDSRTVNVDGVRNELDGLPALIAANRAPGFTQALLRPSGWLLEDPALIRLFDRLMSEGKPLGEYVNGRIYFGIKTGLNEAFVIDEATRNSLVAVDPRSSDLIRPWLRGRDIKRWKVDWQGLHVIAVQNSGDWNASNPWASAGTEQQAREIFSRTYPAIHDHLAQWEDRLRPRADQGRFWWELRACAYYEELDQPKIIWPDIAKTPRFAVDLERSFVANTCYFSPGLAREHVALLNGPVGLFLMNYLSPSIQNGYRRYFTQYIETLPLPNFLPSSVQRVLQEAIEMQDESLANAAAFEAYNLAMDERRALETYWKNVTAIISDTEEHMDQSYG